MLLPWGQLRIRHSSTKLIIKKGRDRCNQNVSFKQFLHTHYFMNYTLLWYLIDLIWLSVACDRELNQVVSTWVHLLVGLSAGLHKNHWMDLHGKFHALSFFMSQGFEKRNNVWFLWVLLHTYWGVLWPGELICSGIWWYGSGCFCVHCQTVKLCCFFLNAQLGQLINMTWCQDFVPSVL